MEVTNNSPPPDYGSTAADSNQVDMKALDAEAGSPPQYDDAPPPSYDSIMGRITKAKEESSGNMDYAMKVAGMACCGTVCCSVMIVLFFAIPIAHIVIGSLYLKDCTIERYIPIYLIVSGCFGIVKAIANSVDQCLKRKNQTGEEGEEDKPRKNPVDGIVSCFLTAWFIAGSVWIYRIYKTVELEDPTSPLYCHKTLYLYAFWTQTVSYIFMALGIFFCCAMCCVMFCVAGKSK